MNTVFKSYIQAWMLLAISLPVLIKVAIGRPRFRAAGTAVLMAAALPHLVWMVLNQLSGRPLGLDGMAWMHPGDRAIVRHLRAQPTATTLVEAVGGAYTEYARFSAYSGVPAYIGWENHELVWRGHGVTRETNRRAQLVRELYSCGDPAAIRSLVDDAGVHVVTIGALERKDYPRESLDAIRRAGAVELDEDGGVVVRFKDAVVVSEGVPGMEDDHG
jgi:uncharacterized membrane protein